MAHAFVEFDKVDLAYDETSGNAIEDISMTIREGEFIAIVGPSGCGKSTFMKLCTGLKAPTKGTVIVNGPCDGYADVPLPDGWEMVILPENLGLGGALNWFLKEYPSEICPAAFSNRSR